MDMQEMMRRYAELLVVHGAHVQPGQVVNVAAEVYHRDLAYMIAQAAYDKGAKFVILDLSEPRLQRYRLQRSKAEFIDFVPPHVETKYKHLVDEIGATIKLVGPEYPLLFADLDPKRVNQERKAFYSAVRYFYDEGIGKSNVHWTMGAAATPQWGERIFPGKSPAEAERLLWEAIFKIVRVDRDNYLQVWKEHNQALHRRAKLLSDLKVSELRFTGPGTDLRVGLSPRAIFKGGTDRSPRGVDFEPNIPTEECFTTPDYHRTEGTVSATRPFLINGVLIRDLKMTFSRGEITSFSATAGEETFREYISTDSGARRLGEVALVGIDSPVYQSGLIFEEILFDENAACHVAIGSAYKFCLEGGNALSDQECDAIGCNESIVHTDIMISSSEVSVEADTARGKQAIIKNGEWVEEFR